MDAMSHNPTTDGTDPAGSLENARKSVLAPPTKLPSFTPEERAAHREKAAASRKANAAKRATSSLRRDFLDDDFWMGLARRYSIRLPLWGVPITSGAIQRWLRKLGYSVEWYREWQGEESLGDFARRNPTWPLRAWVGLILEEREYDDAHARGTA